MLSGAGEHGDISMEHVACLETRRDLRPRHWSLHRARREELGARPFAEFHHSNSRGWYRRGIRLLARRGSSEPTGSIARSGRGRWRGATSVANRRCASTLRRSLKPRRIVLAALAAMHWSSKQTITRAHVRRHCRRCSGGFAATPRPTPGVHAEGVCAARVRGADDTGLSWAPDALSQDFCRGSLPIPPEIAPTWPGATPIDPGLSPATVPAPLIAPGQLDVRVPVAPGQT
jgi:hypothetical protein